MQANDRRTPALELMVLMAAMLLGTGSPVRAQLPPADEERLQILSDPEAIKKKAAKDKNRPPFEFFRSRVAPFDVIPYVKANHWATLLFEMRSNDDDYDGFLQSDPVKLLAGSQQVYYRREARLLKEKRANLSLQMMVPSGNAQIPKEMVVEMVRPGALRPDASWQATMTTLPTHQMLVLVLSKEATPKFAAWNRMAAIIPSTVDREGGDIEKLRYYRLVLPMEHDKPALSSHPLTWSTISHTIWDGYVPDDLTVSQQRALLDWIHWGGQLIISGGAGQSFSLLHESFLGPYLPADATAETVPLSQDDLRPLSQSYPPPNSPDNPTDQSQPVPATKEEAVRRYAYRYQAPVPIRPAPNRPLYLSVLKAKPGASTIPLGEASPHLLAVEQRVGRGRITMLTLNPNDESLLAWPGLDTLVRRVVLRRPEEPIFNAGDPARSVPEVPQNGRLLAADLTWYRIMSRDADRGGAPPSEAARIPDGTGAAPNAAPNAPNDPEAAENAFNRLPGVAEWRDTAKLPKLSNDLLDQASGITIPSSKFVLQVIVAYLVALIPLNWLICRFLLNRREWAWVVVPLVALAFAVGVERVAARDIGYDTSADEIDLLEIQGDYARGHLTRVVSLYSNGRSHFSISYPNDPTAVALPFDSGQSIRGAELSSSTFVSYPVPSLLGFTVQPRSLSMFRAEQMLSLSGPIRLDEEGGKRRVVNGGELELHDAILIDQSGPAERVERWLGTIAAGASVEIDGRDDEKPPERVDAGPGPDANPFLSELRTNQEIREENQGELRLVAWVAGPTPGQVIEPAVDRHRGFTAVVVHLRSGSTPSPDGRRYNRLAAGEPTIDERQFEQMQTTSPPSMQRRGQTKTSRRRLSAPPVGARPNQ
jgi:hypothetical protein